MSGVDPLLVAGRRPRSHWHSVRLPATESPGRPGSVLVASEVSSDPLSPKREVCRTLVTAAVRSSRYDLSLRELGRQAQESSLASARLCRVANEMVSESRQTVRRSHAVRLTSRPETHFARLMGEVDGAAIPAVVRRDGSAVARADWLGAADLRPQRHGRGADPLQTTLSLTRSCDRVLQLELLDVRHRRFGKLPDLRAAYDGSWEPLLVHADAFAAEVVSEGAVHRVRLAGELDLASASGLADQLVRAAEPVVEVDLTHLTFLDGSGLTALLQAKRRIRDAGHDLRMVGAQGIVRRVFEVTGLSDELDD